MIFSPVLAMKAAAITPGIRYIARIIELALVFGISFITDIISIEIENNSKKT